MRAMARIQAIYRYPLKGLSAEQLPRTALTTGETVPGDRLYAIENGPCGFDPAMPSYLAKQHFLMLMRNERLAKLHTIFDHSSQTLSLAREGREVARGDLRTQDGRAAVERYFAEFCADGATSFSKPSRPGRNVVLIVTVEAEPEPSHGRTECHHCGGPLNGRGGRFILKYFLIDRPRRKLKPPRVK
jgi:uncharacterized protein YcbX